MPQRKKKVKITFRCVEYHTITREVDSEEARKHAAAGDTAFWLDEKFRDTPMPDSSVSTESFDIDNFEIL